MLGLGVPPLPLWAHGAAGISVLAPLFPKRPGANWFRGVSFAGYLGSGAYQLSRLLLP